MVESYLSRIFFFLSMYHSESNPLTHLHGDTISMTEDVMMMFIEISGSGVIVVASTPTPNCRGCSIDDPENQGLLDVSCSCHSCCCLFVAVTSSCCA